jgi:hypothetical protein
MLGVSKLTIRYCSFLIDSNNVVGEPEILIPLVPTSELIPAIFHPHKPIVIFELSSPFLSESLSRGFLTKILYAFLESPP